MPLLSQCQKSAWLIGHLIKRSTSGYHHQHYWMNHYYNELLLPVESFRCSVALQGHVGLDPTSDREKIQPHRIWPPHTPSPVSSASSSQGACFFPNLKVTLVSLFFSSAKKTKNLKTWIQSFTVKKRWWEETSYSSINCLVPLLLCRHPPLTIL